MSKTQVFIEKARAKHGDRYDYGKVVYVRAHGKVIITCKVHGEFEQTPSNHARGNGCQKCSGKHQHSTVEWIIEAEKTHGDRYDYSKTVYTRAHDKVIITCKVHGDFEQSAASHRVGKGCPICSGKGLSNKNRIKNLKQTHGNTYDYSKTEYVGVDSKIIIGCRTHGYFEQVYHKHKTGSGCPKCSGNHSYSTDEWVAKVRSVHDGRYDYGKAVYTHAHGKVTVTCKDHGDFEQSADSHLRGQGCPRCFWNRDQPTKIYLMQMGVQVKIGISINPEARLSQINRHNPEPARIVTTWTLEDFPTAYMVEQKLHQRLRDYHAGLSGFDGATEWFNTTPCHAEWIINKTLLNANLM